jgi:uncharacterized OB-fold protein
VSDPRLVDDALFVSGTDEITLRGAECSTCSTTTFPHQDSCPRCGAESMVDVALPRGGRLWSFTVQGFEPKPPYRASGEFVEYGVGYVDLGPVIVESRLLENDPARLRVGASMRLALTPAFADPDGTTVLTFAFGQDGEPA